MPISFELTPAMMREIIMDHYSSPSHKCVPTDETYKKIHADSTNCIDDFDLYIKVNDDVVIDACWNGVACTISSASTDILCEQVINKKFADATYMIEQYLNMINEKPYDALVLDEALVFVNTSKQAARIHCATMGWTAMNDLLKDEEHK